MDVFTKLLTTFAENIGTLTACEWNIDVYFPILCLRWYG
jgi:hypothetical protein